MPFTNNEFPGRVFETFEDFEEAKRKRCAIETVLEKRQEDEEHIEIIKVTATVIPAPRDLLERKVAELEAKMSSVLDLIAKLQRSGIKVSNKNKEGLVAGTILRGESKGTEYTIQVLPEEEGYLCSNGEIYQSLSGAALGVSGNRRSGWKFWRNVEGTSIGEVTGRFLKSNAASNPFDSR